MARLSRQEVAVSGVGDWLSTLPGSHRRLSAAELARYRSVEAILGWRIDVTVEGMQGGPAEAFGLDILVDSAFPYSPARIAVGEGLRGRRWPHVEGDGVLCLLPNSASIDVDAPTLVLQHQLSDACALIEVSLAGANSGDFLSEVMSYWTRGVPRGQTGLRSLISPNGPSRIVKVWKGKHFDLVADDAAVGAAWLTNLGVKAEARDFTGGLLLWMDRPPLPNEYPGTGSEFRALVSRTCPEAKPLLEQLVADSPTSLITLIGASTENGPGLLGAILSRGQAPQRPNGRGNQSAAGFTGRTIPASVAVPRFLGAATVQRRLATRVDAAWIHGRGLDSRTSVLGNATVVVLGCGSVGAPIAVRLAQAGVGSLVLVDDDALGSSNVGRHPLGMNRLNAFKAVGLAAELRVRFPHMKRVEAIPDDWASAHAKHPELLGSCDLVVAAMADWTANSMLNDWHIGQRRQKPILYTWTEAHACAGHAVLIAKEGGCLRCGFSSTGTPRLRVCEWSAETHAQEPACGAVFQPYGPVEMAHIEALACELALDALISLPPASTHRIWAARQTLLKSTGGRWTSDWITMHPDRGYGGFMDDRPWFQGDCPSCREVQP